jgi:FixJ family two-component response regulator
VRAAAQTLIGIVDDLESSREGISSLLRTAGYNTVAFESVEAFLDARHRYEVHCLVLDIDMPGSGDLELKRQLEQMNVTVPIVFVTGRENLLQTIALKEGAGAILGKPFTYEALLKAIRSSLDFPGDPSRRR